MKSTLRQVFIGATLVCALVACETPKPQPSVPTMASGREALGSSAAVAPAPETRPSAAARIAARDVANNCFTCHGPNGRSPGAIPSLDRLSAQEIARKLVAFKSGAQPSTIMGRQATAYSDAEIDAVAAYIAQLNR